MSVKLRHLDAWTGGRQSNAQQCKKLFEASGLVGKGRVQLPAVIGSRHRFNQYVIRAQRRDERQAFLKQKDIGTVIYYLVPTHL